MSYTLTQNQLSSLKRKLTHAKNLKQPRKIIEACDAAMAVFEECGYPDCWSDWQRAKDDANFQLERATR